MKLRGPHVSFVLATHNRCAVVMNTLSHLSRCGLDRRDYEIILVDNASDDGTPEAADSQADLILRLRRNAGSCAKVLGVERASGRYIVFLDDDSFPRPGSITRMIEHFETDPKLGAAGFTVHLPDGRREGGALPGVFLGCGVGFQAEALHGAGGLDRTFFMQAEEYDLSFRLVASGWTINVFDDLHVDHLKTPQARKTDRTTYFDVRNNLRIVSRYLPSPQFEVYREDLLQRYGWLAQHDGHVGAFKRGVRAGRRRGVIERLTYRARRLSPASFEYFYRWAEVREHMAGLRESGVRRIVLADLGKNVHAFYQAARGLGIDVTAIGDDRFCAAGRSYRGIPIVGLDDALGRDHDAVVVANASAIHGGDTYERVAARASQPVYFWFGPTERAAGFSLRGAPCDPKVAALSCCDCAGG
jgi:GT2 family glycosyltransferase